MRRTDREIMGMGQILDIIRRCKVIRIAINTPQAPYIIPLNFGYSIQDGRLELCFHCAREGKKLELLKVNSLVGFEMDGEHRLITGDSACSYSYEYESITGTGKAKQVIDEEEKRELLQKLMEHQTGKTFTFTSTQLGAVIIFKIEIISLTGKANVR